MHSEALRPHCACMPSVGLRSCLCRWPKPRPSALAQARGKASPGQTQAGAQASPGRRLGAPRS